MAKLIIEAGSAGRNYWRDLWAYRELFLVLAWRDLSVRYKQTAVGLLWALLRPFLTIVIFTAIFGKVAGFPTVGAAPYAIMVCAALLPWQFFSNALSESGASLVANSHLISKVYFPRLIVPGSTILVTLADLLISLLILGGLMAGYHFWPTWRLLTLPLWIVVAFLSALGPGLIISALNVRYRDMRHVIPFIVQFGLYVSPVGFSSEIVRTKFGETAFFLYSLNPMVGAIEGFRWAICGSGTALNGGSFAISLGLALGLLGIGLWYFRRTETSFADVV